MEMLKFCLHLRFFGKKIQKPFCLPTGEKIFPLKRENDQLFLCLKEKVAKRSKQACRLTAGAIFLFGEKSP